MSEPYLILHKVRGEPAFDIAVKLEPFYYTDLKKDDEAKIAGETMWIIPTSGHRAYPSWSKPLSELGIVTLPDTNMAWGYDFNTGCVQGLIPYPYDDPDHYSANETPKPKPASVPRVTTKTDDFLL